MPPPPILASKRFASGTPASQVHEISGGTTPTQIGSDAATITDRPLTTASGPANMSGFTKTFKGERYLLGVILGDGSAVAREDEGGAGNWGQVYAAPGVVRTSGHYMTGLHICKDGNDVALCYAFATSSSIGIVKSLTGQAGSWSTVIVALGGNFTSMTGISVTFRNRIYVRDSLNSRVLEIDPEAGAVTTIPLAGTQTVALAVADDKLFAAAVIDGGGGELAYGLYELGGGGFSLNSTIEGTVAGRGLDLTSRSQALLFEDPLDAGKLIAVMTGRRTAAGSTQGTRVFQGTPSGGTYTWVEDTADLTMLASLIPGARGDTTNATQDRFALFMDNDTDPLNPVAYIIAVGGPAPGTIHEMARWEGWLQRMGSGVVSGDTGPGASVSTSFSIGHSPIGGGEDISQGPATFGEIEDETAVPGAYRLSYRTPGTVAGLTGRVIYNLGQGTPNQLATLVGGGTTFGPITGDARASLRTVDVNLVASGITSPDASTWMIDLR